MPNTGWPSTAGRRRVRSPGFGGRRCRSSLAVRRDRDLAEPAERRRAGSASTSIGRSSSSSPSRVVGTDSASDLLGGNVPVGASSVPRSIWGDSGALLEFPVACVAPACAPPHHTCTPSRTSEKARPVANIKSRSSATGRTTPLTAQQGREDRPRVAVRKFRRAPAESGDKEKAVVAAQDATRKLDKAASKGVIHKNQAATASSAITRRPRRSEVVPPESTGGTKASLPPEAAPPHSPPSRGVLSCRAVRLATSAGVAEPAMVRPAAPGVRRVVGAPLMSAPAWHRLDARGSARRWTRRGTRRAGCGASTVAPDPRGPGHLAHARARIRSGRPAHSGSTKVDQHCSVPPVERQRSSSRAAARRRRERRRPRQRRTWPRRGRRSSA